MGTENAPTKHNDNKHKWVVYISKDAKRWGISRDDQDITLITDENDLGFAAIYNSYAHALKRLMKEVRLRDPGFMRPDAEDTKKTLANSRS